MKYTDASGVPRTLTPYQRALLQVVAKRGHHPVKSATISARLLEERGLLTTQGWHCPLDPRCITGLTRLGKVVVRDLADRQLSPFK